MQASHSKCCAEGTTPPTVLSEPMDSIPSDIGAHQAMPRQTVPTTPTHLTVLSELADRMNSRAGSQATPWTRCLCWFSRNLDFMAATLNRLHSLSLEADTRAVESGDQLRSHTSSA